MNKTRKKGGFFALLFFGTALGFIGCPCDDPFDNPLDPLVVHLPGEWRTYQNLDEEESAWVMRCIPPDIICDGKKTMVTQPSIDSSALRISLKPGTPNSNVQFFRNLPFERTAKEFRLSLYFKYNPKTTYNNNPEASIIQAIEFSMSKWLDDKRWEWAIQWENVAEAGAVTNPPIMRIWDGKKWIDKGPRQNLVDTTWYHLALWGDIKNEKVRYISFELNGILYPLGDVFEPQAQSDSSKIAVHVQLDGTPQQFPYDVFADKVHLMFNY